MRTQPDCLCVFISTLEPGKHHICYQCGRTRSAHIKEEARPALRMPQDASQPQKQGNVPLEPSARDVAFAAMHASLTEAEEHISSLACLAKGQTRAILIIAAGQYRSVLVQADAILNESTGSLSKEGK